MAPSYSPMQVTHRPIEPLTTYSTADLFVVPRDQVAAAWPQIERCISRIRDVAWSLDDVRRDLETGQAQAWGLRGETVLGFWITRIQNTSAHRYGLVWITAGEGLREGLPVYRDVIEP